VRGLPLALLLCAGTVGQAIRLPAAPCFPGSLVYGKGLLYLGCAAAHRVDVLDTGSGRITRSFPTPAPPAGLALSPDGKRLYIACSAPRSVIRAVELASGARFDIPAGHSATAPAVSPDGKILYVCQRFQDRVAVIDVARRAETARIPVTREPIASALTPDGKLLFVANALPAGRADASPVAAEVDIIDTARREVAARVRLPNGATGLHGIAVSPDGRLAAVTHLLARFYLPTTQLERGWMQTNAVSLIDVAQRRLLGSVLLDEIDRGAANPWGVAWTPDGGTLAVTHAGTHELSLIDTAAMLQKLAAPPRDPAMDLAFLVGMRQRLALAGRGPRALAAGDGRLWVAGYYSDTLEPVDPKAGRPGPAIRRSAASETPARRGEYLFNDASICFQNWQSCASCHGPDARVDGLNWDLLNDGIGNPKNAKSLLLAHSTPPAMSQGVREDAVAAVRAGLEFILFASVPESDAQAIDAYLKSLRPVPSPYLENGKLSAGARRGRALFHDAKVGCAQCHPERMFTDLKPYDVGTRARTDRYDAFDTPTLVEVWRTAPYLHDGSAPTLRDVLTTANPRDRHGKTSHLTKQQIDDLLAYILSL
jgi:YVTN family beta-propeller protein